MSARMELGKMLISAQTLKKIPFWTLALREKPLMLRLALISTMKYLARQ
jgi:hypothetical protein